MIEIDKWIQEFKLRVDPSTIVINSISGEDGNTTRVLFNSRDNIYYYLSYIREWFYSFGKVFNKSGVGESIDEPKLKHAIRHDNSWIVVAKPVDEEETGVKFYGYMAKDWYNYAIKNKTIKTPKNRYTNNYSIEAKLLRNMDGFNTNG